MFNPPMYRIFLNAPKYCRFTDGLLGERRIFQFAVYTEEMARHIVKKLNKEEEVASCGENYYSIYFGCDKVQDKSYENYKSQVVPDDDIPF